MKREALTVVGACAIAVPAMAQGPGGLGAPRVGTPTEVDPQGGALASEVLYDSLSIVDDQTYDVATGNAIGRVPLIGDVFDARNADDFYVSGDEGFTITRVTADYISYEGIHPIGVYVRIYSDDAGLPGEVPIHEKLVTDSDISVAPFDDTVIGLEGLRITCSNLCMPLGGGGAIYWINIQPVHTGSDGDWYYYARDTTRLWLEPTAGRDGELGAGGYGTMAWEDMGSLGWGGGYGSMKLEGHRGRLTVHAPAPGLTGANNTIEVHGGEPGATIALYYSLNPGTTKATGCPGVALNLQNAISAGPATAGRSGIAQWNGFVPDAARNRTVYYQAVDASDCCLSPLLAWTYPN